MAGLRRPKTLKRHKKIIESAKNQKTSRVMQILALRSSTRSLHFTGKRGFRIGTDRHTDSGITDIATKKLNQPTGPIQGKGLTVQAIVMKIATFKLNCQKRVVERNSTFWNSTGNTIFFYKI